MGKIARATHSSRYAPGKAPCFRHGLSRGHDRAAAVGILPSHGDIMLKRCRLKLSGLALLAVPSALLAQGRFEITVPAAAHAGPITGRVYVALSKTSDGQRTPIQQTGETGVPLFGVDINETAPGRAIVVDAQAFGFPVRSLRD